MIGKRIPQLPNAPTVGADDLLVIEQDGRTKHTTAGDVVGGVVIPIITDFVEQIVEEQAQDANYLLDATDSVERTINERLGDIVSVKDFGAVGDGVADDTDAINKAIAVMPTTGGTVLFPRGVYRTTSTIVMERAGLSFNGAGASLRVGYSNAGGVLDVGVGKHEGATRIVADFTSGPVIRVQNAGQTIRDLVVDASDTRRLAALSTNYGIHIESLDASGAATKGFLIEQVRVINQPSHGIVAINDIASSRIDMVDVDNVWGHGIFVSGGVLTGRTFVARPGQLQLNNCRVSRTGGHSLLVGGNEATIDDVPYRIEVRNMETFFNLVTPAIAVGPYNAYIAGENCSVSDSAFDGRTQYPATLPTHTALYLSGNNHTIFNQRLISVSPYAAYVGVHPILGTHQIHMNVLISGPIVGTLDPAIFIETLCEEVLVYGGRPFGAIINLTNRASVSYTEVYNGTVRTNAPHILNALTATTLTAPTLTSTTGTITNLTSTSETVGRSTTGITRTQDEFTIVDDGAGYFQFGAAARGILHISGSIASAKAAVVHFRCGDGSAHATVLSGSAGVVGTTGVLTGTTGVDGNLTVSADTATNRVYIENRTGNFRSYTVFFAPVSGSTQTVSAFT